MSETATPRSRVQRLASLIEQDLRRRGLASGDPYLTATEAGDDFGVDPFTATRAMSLLAKRGILIRKRGVGTFVGQCEPRSSSSALRCIHILKGPARDDARWSFPVGELVEGLHESLPGYQVQSDILSPQSFADFVRQIIERRTADGSLAGMILMGCPGKCRSWFSRIGCRRSFLEARIPTPGHCRRSTSISTNPGGCRPVICWLVGIGG